MKVRAIMLTAALLFALIGFAQQDQQQEGQSEQQAQGVDQLFAQAAMESNSFEVQSSQLALERSENEEVRNFAQRMIDEHTAAGERLSTVAQGMGLDLTQMGMGVVQPGAGQTDAQQTDAAQTENEQADAEQDAEQTEAEQTEEAQTEQAQTDQAQAGQAAQQMGAMAGGGLSPAHQFMLQQLMGLQGEEFDRAYLLQQTNAHLMAVSLFAAEVEMGQDEGMRSFASELLPTLQGHLDAVRQLLNGMEGAGTPETQPADQQENPAAPADDAAGDDTTEPDTEGD